jgi:spermidine synthase
MGSCQGQRKGDAGRRRRRAQNANQRCAAVKPQSCVDFNDNDWAVLTRDGVSRRVSVEMLPLLLILFVGSGCAALIYEIVWFQLLELVIGSSAVSIGVLLGTFMAGMCLGSLLLPRVVSLRHHPLRVYAALEAGIGLSAMVLLALMPSVGHIYTAWGGDGAFGFLLRGAVAAVCLLPPTLAMGATLPAVARLVETTPEGIAWLGFFYAGNIVGAVCGSLLAGFYLLRVYDMAVATYVAAGLNFVVAALGLVLASTSGLRPINHPAPDTGCERPGCQPGEGRTGFLSRSRRARTVAVYAAIGLSGFCALAGEVIWTRSLALLFGATVYTFSMILAVFLIGLGIGSGFGSVLSKVVRPPMAFGWCQLLAVAAVGWTAHELNVSLPYWPINPSLSSSVWWTFKLDLVRALWAVLPAAVLWGASFPLALAAVATGGRDPGRLIGGVYAANTIGAVAGALAASLLLIAWVGSRGAQQVMMVLSTVAGLLVLVPGAVGPTSKGRDVRWGQAFALAGALVVAAWLIRSVPPVSGMLVAHGRFAATLLGQAGDIIYVGEGLQSSVAVSRLSNGTLGYHNAGKIQASSAPEDMRLQRMLGHFTTLVPRHPSSVLVIGCGAGVTAGAVSIDPQVDRVTIAEIEPLVPRVVSTYFGPQNHDVVRNPKVRIHIDDARHYLLTTKEKFDAITSDPLDPWVKGAATLYTKEFFEAARDHLSAGGVVTLFVQLYDSSPAAVKSEIATFFDVFPNGIIAGNTFRGIGYDTVLLGQVQPTEIDLDEIEARLRRPEYMPVARSLRDIGLNSAVDLFATYAGRAGDLKEWLRDAAINRDGNLRLQYLAGLGLNMNESDAVYAEMLRYRRFPEGLFRASPPIMRALRERLAVVP